MKKLIMLLWIVTIGATTGIIYWITGIEPPKRCPDCGAITDDSETDCPKCGSPCNPQNED